jgi:uncharacterized membrane protein
VSERRRLRLQVAAVIGVIAAYAALSHHCNSTAGARDLGAALALLPPLAAGLAFIWRRARPAAAVLAGILAAVLLRECWPLLARNFSKVYVLQECAIYGLLGVGFARSLRAGDTPVCTRLADRLHGPLTAREMRYSRQVTRAWALFFFAIAAVTLGLFVFAPLRVWSLFANFCTLPLVGAMFVAEYGVRRRVFPRSRNGGLLATVRVFLTSPR